jgi:hypothetical protein
MSTIGEERRTAALLEQQNPGWMIIFGSYTRQYVAFPLFATPLGSYVSATESRELTRRMRHVETTHAPARTPHAPNRRSTTP